jgi:hypothetical protein
MVTQLISIGFANPDGGRQAAPGIHESGLGLALDRILCLVPTGLDRRKAALGFAAEAVAT